MAIPIFATILVSKIIALSKAVRDSFGEKEIDVSVRK